MSSGEPRWHRHNRHIWDTRSTFGRRHNVVVACSDIGARAKFYAALPGLGARGLRSSGGIVRGKLRIVSLAWSLGAVFLAGCGTPSLPSTTIDVRQEPTPTIVIAHTSVLTKRVDPPWQGLPMETRTKSGKPGDPINVAFEGSRQAIVAAFRAIGWVQADPLGVRDDLRLARAAVLRKPYPTAPISNLYVFGRPEDLGVERELGKTVAHRDHARLWDTHRKDSVTGEDVWIGDAARDISIEIVHYHGSKHHLPIGTTHEIGPDVDAERHLIVAGMTHAGMDRTVVMEPGVGATQNGRNGENNRYYTDGKVALIVLKG